MTTERVLILSADKWDMIDERTGVASNGVTVWYVNDYREDTPVSSGFKPTKVPALPSLLEALLSAKLPAVVEPSFGTRPGAQNKPTLTLTNFSKVGSVNLLNLFSAKAPAAQPA